MNLILPGIELQIVVNFFGIIHQCSAMNLVNFGGCYVITLFGVTNS